MKKLRDIVITMACTWPLGLSAGTVDVPHQFQSGQRALAAEVNENFAAVEGAVDGNAADIAALQQGSAGLAVRVDGEFVGRLAAVGSSAVLVDVTASSIVPGPVAVEESAGLGNATIFSVVSSRGYLASLSTGAFWSPGFTEGELLRFPMFFDAADCAGNRFVVVEGPVGRFSNFEYGQGLSRPPTRWIARQGVVVASPDPFDTTPVYMTRRGAPVLTATMESLMIYRNAVGDGFCINLADMAIDPADRVHSVVGLEANDPAETGIAGRFGGELTLGL